MALDLNLCTEPSPHEENSAFFWGFPKNICTFAVKNFADRFSFVRMGAVFLCDFGVVLVWFFKTSLYFTKSQLLENFHKSLKINNVIFFKII